ncbi:MAG: hypothetical protein ACI4A8_10660, partial [Muribaculaceae bacterium]
IVGFIDPTGIADGLNATLLIKKGELGDTMISAIATIPYIGDVPKSGRLGQGVGKIIDAVNAEKNAYRNYITGIQKHHLIPKAVYKSRSSELSSFLVRDSGKNLKKLPNRFHGNHPAYNKWIDLQINKALDTEGKITQEKIDNILKDATKMINGAYDNFIRTGGQENMNDFFKRFLK